MLFSNIAEAQIVASDTVACAPLTNVEFTSTAGPGDWDFGNGASAPNTDNGKTSYSKPGTYTVNFSQDGDIIDTQEIIVFGNPSPKFTFTGSSSGCIPLTVPFVDQSTGDGTSNIIDWKWTFGDGGTSTEENPVHNYADRGDYVTSLQATNKCGDSTLSKDFMLIFNVGIEDLPNSFTIYPNPVQNGKAITLEGGKVRGYSLRTLDGRLINEGAIVNNVFTVDVVQPAIYVLTLSKDGESVNYRIQVTE